MQYISVKASVKAINSGGIPKPPSKVNEECYICLNSGKLQDKSTPPIKKVIAGNNIKIPNEIKNFGYCIPSSSCFFFANLLKKINNYQGNN